MEAVKLLAAGIGMGWGPCLALSGLILLPYIAATKGAGERGLHLREPLWPSAFLFCTGGLGDLAAWRLLVKASA